MTIALLLAAAVAGGGQTELFADSLTVTPRSNTAIARGAVKVRAPEAEATCDEAEAIYGKGRRVERVVMRGSVRVIRPDGTVATGQTGVFDQRNGLVTLEGSPRIERDVDEVRGKSMVFHLRDDRFEVSEPVVLMPAREGRPHTQIEARRMTVLDRGDRAVFEEEVRMRRDDALATSERAELAFGPEPERALTAMVLQGDVDIRQGERRARARAAVYDPATGDVALEGRPSVAEGADVIRGKRIVLNGQTGAARVETAVARVRSRR